ncbi:MAG: SUF system NifU family Fe-S cluster assembly protein [Dehalococcoidia bacterium]|nr:SUF system NifU family Fe-S cluster assembly protein [Dehalococcoidia bacterium]HCU99641.1 SUF system NifU family Fe-S cluster assembly protein [Dehalococcoidia bacterium]|tara:strand:- start:193 stop:657 length:465 start_codon:yes stop_codon:yes gene_type:complete
MSIAEPQFDELYREVILDHYRKPRNAGSLGSPTHFAEGANPVCGDEIQLDVSIEGDVICEMAFRGQGCSISQSSASMMTERICGGTIADAHRIMQLFEALLLESAEPDPALGDLEALQGVAKFPVRVKCALLSWKVLKEALENTNTEPIAPQGG